MEATVASRVSDASTQLETAAREYLRGVSNFDAKTKFKRGDYALLSLDAELEQCQQKIEAWQESWGITHQEPEETWSYMWGFDGCLAILEMLNHISKLAKSLHPAAPSKSSVQGDNSTKGHLVQKLRHPKQHLHNLHHGQPQHTSATVRPEKLKDVARELRWKIDELRLYSESAFEENHPDCFKSDILDECAELVTIALDSKDASVALAAICSAPTRCFGLDLDITYSEVDPEASLTDQTTSRFALTYKLFLSPNLYNEDFQRHISASELVTLSWVPNDNGPGHRPLIDVSFLKNFDKGTVFSTASRSMSFDSVWSDELRIEESLSSSLVIVSRESTLSQPTPISPIRFDSLVKLKSLAGPFSREEPGRTSSPEQFDTSEDDPAGEEDMNDMARIPAALFRVDSPVASESHFEAESLHSLFHKLEDSNHDILAPIKSPLSMIDKIALAYKIARAGLLLLGTPWLSYLRSENLYRGKDNSCILSVNDTQLIGLPSSTGSDVAEPAQIFYIGILLIELALEQPASSLDGFDSASWSRHSRHHLAAVERAMGIQYCKAVSFCLQPHRAPSFSRSLSKYHVDLNQEWNSFLKEISQEYYTQVYQRIEKLHDVTFGYKAS